jgi:hypothetical protein
MENWSERELNMGSSGQTCRPTIYASSIPKEWDEETITPLREFDESAGRWEWREEGGSSGVLTCLGQYGAKVMQEGEGMNRAEGGGEKGQGNPLLTSYLFLTQPIWTVTSMVGSRGKERWEERWRTRLTSLNRLKKRTIWL